MTLMVGDGKDGNMAWGILNSVKSDKVQNLKSSNPAVLAVKKVRIENEYNIQVNAKKTGTSTISFSVKRKNGKVYRFKSKVSVYKYANPLSKCTLGKTAYKKSFDKDRMATVLPGKAKKEKINVAVKKGYKLTGLYYCEYGTGKQKKIKNGAAIKLDDMHYLRVEYKNTSKKYSYELYLNGSSIS